MYGRFSRSDGFDKTDDAAAPLLGTIGAALADRRTMLMRVGALALGVMALAAVSQATVADDDDGWGEDNDGGYYHEVWGGGYYGDDDGWGDGYDDDGWGDDDAWGDD